MSLVTFSVLDEEIRMLSKVNINKVYLELTIQNLFAIKALTLCKVIHTGLLSYLCAQIKKTCIFIGNVTVYEKYFHVF